MVAPAPHWAQCGHDPSDQISDGRRGDPVGPCRSGRNPLGWVRIEDGGSGGQGKLRGYGGGFTWPPFCVPVARERSALMTTSRDAYIRLEDAADLLGVPRRLLIRRIGDGEIVGLRDPKDRRHTLVRRDDLARIMAPGGGGSPHPSAGRAAGPSTA